jgi:hypothetical protein
MKFGFFGGADDLSKEAASKQIKIYQKKLMEEKKAKDFNVWVQMYAQPFARGLLHKDHVQVVRAEKRAAALAQKPDAGVKAVAELAKISDKLVATKQQQAQVKEQIQKKVAEGDGAGAAQLARADKALDKKAAAIENQLSTRVAEGVDLAKAKTSAEKSRSEVVQKRQAQAAAAPHLAAGWARHDALYERNRAGILMKHDQAEMKAAGLKAQLARLPKGAEKDAKMERLRKEEAKRRVTQELELAKVDSAEAGRLDARALTAGMKKM